MNLLPGWHPGFFMKPAPSGGGGGIILVGSTTGTAVDGGNATVDLTAITGLAQGDLVVVLAIGTDTDIVGNALGISTSGYAIPIDTDELFDPTVGTDRNIAALVGYKFMGSSPDPSVVVTNASTSDQDIVSVVVMAFRGVDLSTPMDATPTINVHNGSTVAADCPPITTVSDGAAVIAMGGYGGGVSGFNPSAAPSGYGDTIEQFLFDPETTANRVDAFMAWKVLASAGVENPGAWGDEREGSIAFGITVALRPATG